MSPMIKDIAIATIESTKPGTTNIDGLALAAGRALVSSGEDDSDST